jgi:hypothetical protein
MKVNIYSIRKVSSYIFLLLYFPIAVVCYFTKDNNFLYVNTIIGVFALLLEILDRKKIYNNSYLLMLLLPISFFVSSFAINRVEFSWLAYFNIFSNIGMAFALLFTSTTLGFTVIKKVSISIAYIIFYIIAIFFIFQISLGIAPENIFIYSSRNSISVVILLACIYFYVISDASKKNIDLIPAFIALIICLWAVGRSGIIASIIILFGLIYLKIKHINYTYLLLMFLLAIVFYLYSSELIDLFYIYIIPQNLMNHINDDFVRENIWYHYFSKLDLYSFVFGVDPYQDMYMSQWAYSYHNSFIYLHSFTGIAGILLLVAMARSFVILYKINKVYFLLLFSLCIRMSSDSVCFFYVFDFIPYYFILYSLTSSKQTQEYVDKCLAHN